MPERPDRTVSPVRRPYMFRRYSPPTSYRAADIWPSEFVFTACISSAKIFSRAHATSCKRARQAL